jgi:hypothetical protein
MEDIRQGTCPLCKHNKIVRGWPTTLGFHGTSFQPIVPVMAMNGERSAWGEAVAVQGPLYACVCQRCGYAQWFAHDPAKIPVDEESGNTLLVGREPAGPYR